MAKITFLEGLNDFLGITNDTSAPIITSILVFLIGGVAISLKNVVSEFIKRKHNRETFGNIVKEISKTSLSKSKRVKEFYITMNLRHDTDWTFKNIPITYLSIAFNQDYSSILHSYNFDYSLTCTNGFKTKCFNKIWSVIESMKFMEERIIIEFDNFNQKFNRHENKYGNYLEKIRQQNDKLIQEINTTSIPKTETRLIKYIQSRDKIFYEWQQMTDLRAIFNTHDHLIVPLRDLNRTYSEIDLTNQQNDLLLPAIYEYNEMVKTLEAYQSIFRGYYFGYRHGSKYLEFCLKKIK